MEKLVNVLVSVAKEHTSLLTVDLDQTYVHGKAKLLYFLSKYAFCFSKMWIDIRSWLHEHCLWISVLKL